MKSYVLAAFITALSSQAAVAEPIILTCKGTFGKSEREIGLIYDGQTIYFDGSAFETQIHNNITINSTSYSDKFSTSAHKSLSIDRITGIFHLLYFENAETFFDKTLPAININGVKMVKAAQFNGICRKSDLLL
ncbi:hypothetical protein Brsp07_03630 [Brucella sp. NBRC 14130]|uniref:hypothetical protein n=1 Tax=Brucella sp. NBRC 14130 TaxID=3075483 RepID=UPI0030AD2BEF